MPCLNLVGTCDCGPVGRSVGGGRGPLRFRTRPQWRSSRSVFRLSGLACEEEGSARLCEADRTRQGQPIAI